MSSFILLPDFKLSKCRFRLATCLAVLSCVFVHPQAISQPLPNEVKLGVRTTVPPIGDFRAEGSKDVWSGFCRTFGQALERELNQSNENAEVVYRRVKNEYLGVDYPRWGSLLTKDPNDRLDMQCGPNSAQAIQNDEVIFSDVAFYETGIKLLLKRETFDQYLADRAQDSLETLEFIKQAIEIGAIVETTTLDRLKSSNYSVYRYDTRELLLDALEKGDVQAFASDGIILRVLMETGVEGGKPFKDQDYVLFPDKTGYLLGKSERYSIAISNEGGNKQYALKLSTLTNRVLTKTKFLENEREKLAEYELGESNTFDLKNIAVVFLSIVAIIVVCIVLINFLKRRKAAKAVRYRGIENSNFSIGSVTIINNMNASQDLTQAAPYIQELVQQAQREGNEERGVDVATKKVAEEIATQAQSNEAIKSNLLKWGQSLAEATVSDVVKEVVKLALRSLEFPFP